MLYIQKEIEFWEISTPLPASYKVGTTEEEYNDGAYLLLDAEQEQFHTDHPEASPLECWNKALTPEPEPTPEELLWQARDKKRQEVYDMDIYHYYIDEQDAYVGDTLRMKDKCNRQSEVEVNGNTYPAKLLSVALDEMADYAEQCAKVTNTLLTAIDSAETAEAVEAIEVTGYPEVIHTTTETLQSAVDYKEQHDPEVQVLKVNRMAISTMSLDDTVAIQRKYGHAEWKDFIGGKLETGNRVLNDNWLWKVRQTVDPVLEIYPPSIDTASLYERMDEQHEGTVYDPKLYAPGMTLETGLYYTEQVDGIRRKYYCFNGTEQAVYAHLSELVDINVKEVKL